MSTVQTALAQNPITTLVHAGNTSVFYGQNSLVDAYTASVNGDYLYLSTGYFTAPAAIAKGVKIIGAGHFPDSANVAKRTTIMSTLSINAGADSLRLEGMYINGDINFDTYSTINYIKIIRCRLSSSNFNPAGNATPKDKNYCSFEECFIFGGIYFSNNGINFLLSKCVLSGQLNSMKSALITNNIFLYIGGFGQLNNVYSSVLQNNIILYNNPGYNDFIGSNTTGNTFNNNLFVKSATDLGTNNFNNNYMGIAQANIFVNQTGNIIDYTHDYHLKNPTTYIGTDGTQVGLYGGATPFKDKGAPSNPQILTKTVGDQTDTNGNLQINFKVKAQDN